MDASNTTPSFADGQKITCPVCGKPSIVKIRHRIENFKIVESYPECVKCKGRLDALPSSAAKPHSAPSALASLLGESREETRKRHEKQELEKRALASGPRVFCRDCRHYIHHPFLSRCTLHGTTVEPMDSCDQFDATTPHHSADSEN